MPKVSVTATTEGCLYDGIPHRKGSKFQAELTDARLLRTLGKVTFEDPTSGLDMAHGPDRSAVIRTKVETAETSAEPEQPQSKRRYRRRDLTAEA